MSTLTRRQFMAGACVGVGAATVGPQVATATPAPEPVSLDHEQARHLHGLRGRLRALDREIVDGVDDLGLDPTGVQDASARLQQAANSGQVVELPPGDYRLDRPVTTGASGWGIRGTGDTPAEVRLRGTGRMLLVDQQGGRNVTIENVAMHNDADGESGVGMTFRVAGGLVVRNVHHLGLSPREGVSGDLEEFNDQEGSLTINITSPTGVGLVDGFRKTSPTEVSGHAENDAPFNSWGAHRGICYVRNSTVHNAGGDGATYLARTPGGWRFDNCAFYNNYASSLRLGGGQSWVRNSTIVIDHANDAVNDVLDGLNGSGNPIVWESSSAVTDAGRNRAGGLVDNCRIELLSTSGCRGCITVDGSHGGVMIRNTTIRNDTRFKTIVAERPGSSFMNDNEVPANPHGMWLENVTVTGSTDHGVEIQGRNAGGVNVCVGDRSVTGLPADALGCGDADATPPGWVAGLLDGLGAPDPASGAPPAVEGAVGGVFAAAAKVLGAAVIGVAAGAAALLVLPVLVIVGLAKVLLD